MVLFLFETTYYFYSNYIYIYNARKHGFLSFNNFLNEVSKVKNLEKRGAGNNRNKCERFRKKLRRIENEVP